MSVRVEVKSNIPQYQSVAEQRLDKALQSMAKDIEIIAKVKKAPVKKGPLAASIVHDRKGRLSWFVEAGIEYARFQEFGGDKKRRVKNYSKPGTGAHFMRDSKDLVEPKAPLYIRGKLKLINFGKNQGKDILVWRSK